MFEDFANVWTPLGLARDVASTRMTSFQVANERVVVFRDPSGDLAALVDKCPHRGVALSLGKIKDGLISCPFHGWQFDSLGRNCLVPWNSDAKREALGATALPVREVAGLIWLYTGFNPETSPLPGEALARKDVSLTAQSMVWNVHWTRVMENMLDTPHLPFVHRRSIGRGLIKELSHDMEMIWEPRAYGADIRSQFNGRPRGAGLTYRYPNVMELIIDPPGKTFRLLAVCTPQTLSTTCLTIYTIRNFAKFSWLDPVFRRLNRRIALEDKAIVESSQPSEVPRPAEECSVRTDRPTLAFRKIYFDQIKGSRSIRPAP